MTSLWQDMVHGFQMLLKKPGLTVVAALSLALGIGANTVIFSLINGTLLRPLAFSDPDRLMVVWKTPVGHPDQRNAVNVSSYFAIRDRNASFESLGVFNGAPANIGAEQNGAPAERINGQTFSSSMFKVIGAKPRMGRIFTPEEERTGDTPAPVVIISDRLWQSHFNRDPNVVGKTLVMDTTPITVIGVMPADFNFFDDDADFWIPQPLSRLQIQSKSGFLVLVARLKKDVSMKQAQAEMAGIAAQLASGDPERNQGMTAQVQSLQEAAYGGLKQPLLLLQGAVVFVLLIGCANVAGLMLARAATRRTEMAVRTALGAGRSRIVRQLVTESVPLAILGGVLGVFLAWAGLKLILVAAPEYLKTLNISLDASVLGFTALIAILTAVVFGLVPAIQASNPDLVSSLKESGRSGTDSATRQHLRSALVTLQIGLALVLLIGAGLMINSFLRVQHKDLGADPKGLLTFEFRFPQGETIKPYSRYRGVGLWDVSPQTGMTFERVLERMQGLPGVISAAGINRPPLSGGGISMPFLIEGHPVPPPSSASGGGSQEQGQMADYFAITANYFGTMRVPILRGRDFNSQDTAAAPPAIIVSETFAKRFFPNEDPIGKRITLDFVPDEKPREIIAVVGDTVANRFQKQGTPGAPVMYVPHRQQTPRWLGPYWNDRASMTFVLRTTGDPLSLVPAVRRAAAEVDPNKPAANLRTVENYLDQQVQSLRLYILLLGAFGAIAAVLAAIGIYGVMAYSVAERTREIGIRMALGAGGREVLRLVVRQALILIAIGLGLGLAGSFALTRMVQSALYGVTATDPATFTGVSLLLIVVALIACLVPTRRAVRVDPTVALRYE
jgi:putative ABC transport system permease protein